MCSHLIISFPPSLIYPMSYSKWHLLPFLQFSLKKEQFVKPRSTFFPPIMSPLLNHCCLIKRFTKNPANCMSPTLSSHGLMKQMHEESSEQRRQASGEKPVPLQNPHLSLSLFLSPSLEGCIFGISSLLSDPIQNIHRGTGESRLFLGFCNMAQEIMRIRGCLQGLHGDE